MSKGKKRSGARPGRPQPLRGTKGKRKGARLWYFCVFFNDTATTEIYTLSLHDALPISSSSRRNKSAASCGACVVSVGAVWMRSEEHTSELQSRFDLVCRLLLEKKK